MHLALFPLATPDSSTDDIDRRRKNLIEIVRGNPDTLTLINTRYVIICLLKMKQVVSLMHINIAVSRAIINSKAMSMKTSSVCNEILYHMYPTHSVSEFRLNTDNRYKKDLRSLA